GSRDPRKAGAPELALHGEPAYGAVGQGARRRRNARLGAGAVIAPPRPFERGTRRGNAGLCPQGCGRREAFPPGARGRRSQALRPVRGVAAVRVPAPRDLTTAMLRFVQMLRAAGLPVTVSELMDAVRALNAVDLMDREEVYLALRAVLVV